jgi:hypothetical protein
VDGLVPRGAVLAMARAEEATMVHRARIYRLRLAPSGPGGASGSTIEETSESVRGRGVKCRVAQYGGGAPIASRAGQPVEALSWRVSFPRGTDVQPGDLLRATGTAEGLRFEHDFTVTGVDDTLVSETRRRAFCTFSGPLSGADPRAELV